MRAFPRRFLQNMFSTYAAQVVLGLQVVLVTPLLVHGLGPERYGIWALIASIGLIVSLLDLGLGSATVRYVAHHDALDERPNVVRTVAVSFWILTVLGGLAFVLAVLISPALAALFSVPGEELSTALLVILVAASVAIMFVGGAFGGCLAGLQYHSVNNAFNASIAIIQTAGFALVLTLGGGLVSLGVVLVDVALAALIIRYVVLRRFVPEISLSWKLVNRVFAKQVLGMTTWISSIQAATVIRYRIDTLVVGFVAGVRAAGVYAVGQLMFVAVNRFIQPALTGFFPFSAELAGKRDRDGLRVTMVMGTRLTLAVAGTLCLPVIFLAGPLIDAWVGPGFEDARLVVVFLVSSLLLGAVTRSGFAMLEGSGHYRPKAVILWAEAALNVTLSIGLGLLIGMQGVALATLIATAAISTAVGLPYVCRTYGLSGRAFLGSIARAHIPAVCAALVVAWLVYPGDRASFLTIVGAGSAIALAYLSTLAVTGLSRDERRRLRGLLRHRKARFMGRLRVVSRRLSGDR